MIRSFCRKLSAKLGFQWKTVGLVLGLCAAAYLTFLYVVQTLSYGFSESYTGKVSIVAVVRFSRENGINWPLMHLFSFFLLILLIIGIWRSRQKLKEDERKFHYSKSGVYGTAGILEEGELEGIAEILTPAQAQGTILGQMDDTGRRLIVGLTESRYNRHMVVFGASSSGKSISHVEPAIIQACKRRESLILTDPKGELYGDTVAYLKANGYEIRRFDLVNMELSDGWDCLGEVNGSISRAEIFANSILENSGLDKSRDQFYLPKKALLEAAILRVSLGDDYEGRRTLAEVFDLVNRQGRNLDLVFNINEHPEIGPAVGAYNAFVTGSANFVGNVISGVNTLLLSLLEPLVRKITGQGRIDMTLPGQMPCAYYLILSDKVTNYRYLSALFFSYLFLDLMDFADIQSDRKLPVPVNFILDEVKNVGVIPLLDEKIATCRSRLINITLCLQGLSQLKQMYPETWSSILSNSAIQIGLGFNDKETAEYFSERTGQATVQVQTEKHEAYESIFRFSRNKSTGDGKRNVFTADELQRLGVDEEIIVFQGRNVMKARKYPVFRHPEYKKWTATDAFHEIPLITDEEGRAAYYEREDARVVAYAEKLRNGFIPEVQRMEDEPGDDPAGTVNKILDAAKESVKESKWSGQLQKFLWNRRKRHLTTLFPNVIELPPYVESVHQEEPSSMEQPLADTKKVVEASTVSVENLDAAAPGAKHSEQASLDEPASKLRKVGRIKGRKVWVEQIPGQVTMDDTLVQSEMTTVTEQQGADNEMTSFLQEMVEDSLGPKEELPKASSEDASLEAIRAAIHSGSYTLSGKKE